MKCPQVHIFLLLLVAVLETYALTTFARTSTNDLMKCSYGERGSLTATCVNATASFFKLTSYRFDNLDETLRCVNCSLSSIESATFDISGNQIQNLDLRHSSIKSLKPKSFVGLIFLKTLDLSYNEISSIYPTTFVGVKKILMINLESNQINILSDEGFLELTNLEILVMRNNNIATISTKAFDGLSNLRILDLSNNSITDLGVALGNLTKLENLYLQDNRITTLRGNEFFNLTNLLEINLSRNKMKSPVISMALNNNLRRLDLSFNYIDILSKDMFNTIHAVEDLDLSFNNIKDVPQKTWLSLYSLRNLNISYNKLTVFQTGLFSGLPQLRLLNCSHNSIDDIEVTGVLSLHSLHALDLSYNNISDLDYELLITRLPKLSYLAMQNNYLSCDLENLMEHFFSEDNFKFVLYENVVGSRKCVDIPVATKEYRKAVADTLESKHYVGTRTMDVWIFVLISLILVLLGVLFYAQYHLYYSITYNRGVRCASTSQLISSDLEARDTDFLKE